MYPKIESTSHLFGIEQHFFLPYHCQFITNSNMQATATQDAAIEYTG